MYMFYYDKLKEYDPDLNLLYVERDSYLLEMRKDPIRYECYSVTNKKVIGQFKDDGVPLEEYYSLWSKLNTYRLPAKDPKKEIRWNVKESRRVLLILGSYKTSNLISLTVSRNFSDMQKVQKDYTHF